MRLAIIAASLLSALWIPFAVLADSLEEIVVNDQEPPLATGDVVASETTAATTIVSGDILKRPAATLSRVLSREAGVQIRQSGGLGSFSSATLRGASSDQVMVYLDGLLLNDASGGGFNLNNIDLLQVDTVEIYRGTTPVQLSNASLGGAINLRTTSLNYDPGWRAIVGGGSFGSRRAGALWRGAAGSISGLLSVNGVGSDNDFPFRNDNGTAFNTEDDSKEHRNNAELEQYSLLAKIDHRLSSRMGQDGSFQYFKKTQHLPNANNAPTNHAVLNTGITRFQLGHRMDEIKNTRWNMRFGLNLSRKREEYRDEQSAIGLGRQHDRWTTDIAGISNYWEHIAETRSFSLMADFRFEKTRSEDLLKIFPDDKARRNTFSLSMQESLFFINDRLLITPELRYQVIKDDFNIINQGVSGGALQGRVSQKDLSPRLGLKFEMTPTLSLTSNLARYHRVPSFFELFGDRGLFIGNESLKPESGNNFDAGFQWRSKISNQWFKKPSADVAVFYSDVSDAISRVYNARGIGKSINIEGAVISGIEWDLRSRVGDQLEIQIKGTFQNTENRSFIPAFFGKRIPGQAESTLNISLDYQLGPGCSAYYDYTEKRGVFYDAANLLPARRQATHTLGLKSIKGRYSVAMEADNLTDNNYEDFNGYPKPGRSFYLTVTYYGDT